MFDPQIRNKCGKAPFTLMIHIIKIKLTLIENKYVHIKYVTHTNSIHLDIKVKPKRVFLNNRTDINIYYYDLTLFIRFSFNLLDEIRNTLILLFTYLIHKCITVAN